MKIKLIALLPLLAFYMGLGNAAEQVDTHALMEKDEHQMTSGTAEHLPSDELLAGELEKPMEIIRAALRDRNVFPEQSEQRNKLIEISKSLRTAMDLHENIKNARMTHYYQKGLQQHHHMDDSTR